MMISEVSKRTKLTKKAIEYYALQNLISPCVLDNGYRTYSNQDIEALNKISVLRKLDLSIEEIKHILNDPTNAVLQTVSVRKELDHQRELMKVSILQKLSTGRSYEEISAELEAVEQGKSITDRLLDAFPGYYGRFICLHFARFLNEPIKSARQQSAYETIISFLDHLPPIDIPSDLEEYMLTYTNQLETPQVFDMLKNAKESCENPDEFLADNKEMLAQYLAYKQSEEYKSSPAYRLWKLMKEFNRANGYNDVFIPAMIALSDSYAEYHRKMEIANDRLLEQYPEIKRLNDE